MSFFDSLFGKTKKKECPHIKFGRFSDNYKAPDKYNAWDAAEDMYRDGKYIESIANTLDYLRNDIEENLFYELIDNEIEFYFYQGSKKIVGHTKNGKLFVEAKIVKSNDLNIGLMRSMLEKNFDLQHSGFFVNKSGELVIKLSRFLPDCSPFSLYIGLKELAINADREDDRLLDEFKSLDEINTDHLVALTDTEKDIKYRFIQDQLEMVFKHIDSSKLNYNELPISTSYLLLSLVYKLDYLIRPEGFVMKILDKSHFLYYAKNGYSIHKKNHKLRLELEKLQSRDKEEIYGELYNVTSTFSVANPMSHNQLIEFIDEEIASYDWYYHNNHMEFAQSITDFIVGYTLFNNTLPKPDRELFHLFYRVSNQSLFEELGFTEKFVINGKPNEIQIKESLQEIININKPIYPNLKANFDVLVYDDVASFSRSLLMMIRILDMYKPEVSKKINS